MPEIEMTRRITIDGTLATSDSIYTLFIERQQITKTQLLDALATYLTKVTKHQVVVNGTTLVSKSNNVLLTSNLNLKSSITFGDLGFLNSPDLKILDVTESNLDSQGNITSSPDAGGLNKDGSLTFKVNQTNANKLVKEFGATEVISITLNYSIQYLATKELDVHSKDLKADYNPYNLTTAPGFKTSIIGTPYMLGATAATADKKFEVTGTSITPSIYNTAPHTLIIPSRIDENYIKSVTGVAATNATLVVVSPGITHIPAGFINSALTRAIYLPSSLTSFDATSILSVNATKCHIYFATEDSKALYLKTLGLYSLENSSVSMPQLRTIDDNDPAQLGLNEIPYDYTQVAGGTVTAEMINAAKTNTTLAVNIYGRKVGDPLRTVGAPFMAYSPRTKFDESQASKEAHGVWKNVNGTNKLVELPNYASTLFSMTFNKDTNSFAIDEYGFVGGMDFENKVWPDTSKFENNESIMKSEVLEMIRKNPSVFQPIIDRGGYITDLKNEYITIDPVNMIIPGLIRVAEGDIDGIPAGDYPVKIMGSNTFGGAGVNNCRTITKNVITINISENIETLNRGSLSNLYKLSSLTLPSSLQDGNSSWLFKSLGCEVTWQGEDNPNNRATWNPDGPRATGLGTQPTDGGGTVTGTLPASQLQQLYYPLSMPYYQKSLEMNGTTKKYEYGNPAGGLLENKYIGGITPQNSKYGGAHFPLLSAYTSTSDSISSYLNVTKPSHVPYTMDKFVGATATDTIKNMLGPNNNIGNQNGQHWKNNAANATPKERTDTVNGLQYRKNSGIDSPRVVGSPVMAYSPRTKTSETYLDKKLHGVINANGTVIELPQYASWQWALKFTRAGVNDVDSYFELVSFIGGPATRNKQGEVTTPNNYWPTQTASNGTRDVFATQAIRNLGLTGTNSNEEWTTESANLRSRGGYIQDFEHHGIDPVVVILPGYIYVSDGDTLYTGVSGINADDYDFTTSIKVGTGVKAGIYPVKRGLSGATRGMFGACGYNQIVSTISQIWTPGFEEIGNDNASYLFNLRSLTYLGTSSFSSNNWGNFSSYNYNNASTSLYYNASDPALKAAFNTNNMTFKTANQALIDSPTGTFAPGDVNSPLRNSNLLPSYSLSNCYTAWQNIVKK